MLGTMLVVSFCFKILKMVCTSRVASGVYPNIRKRSTYFSVFLQNWEIIYNLLQNIYKKLIPYFWGIIMICKIVVWPLFLGVIFFLVYTLFRDSSLCWDRWNGTWCLCLTQPCLLALGRTYWLTVSQLRVKTKYK